MENDQTQPNIPFTPQSTTPPVQTPPSSNLPQNQPSTGGLDPQVVQLTQAIRQVESGGNFQAKGASGEYGAYQFEPATWDKVAPSVLGSDVPLQDATPEQQNQVAYTRIKQLKDAGNNVGQIASIWNAGNPNAYLDNNVGTNAEGVAYNTPAYAQKVAQTYQTIKNGGEVTPQTSGTPNTPDTTAQTMPTWEKLLFGIPLVGAGVGLALATGGAAIPEEVAGAEAVGAAADAGEITGASGGGSILSNLGSKVVGLGGKLLPAGVVAGIDTVKGLITGNKTAQAGEDTANATAQAGSEEAQATQQASEQANMSNEDLADTKEALQAQQNTKQAEDAYFNSLNSTTTGRKLAQTNEGQLGVQGLSQYGVNPNIEDGNFATQENQNEVDKLLEDLNNKEQDIHTASGDTGNLDELEAEAKASMRADKSIPSTEYAKGDEIIHQDFEHYRSQMGTAPTLGRGGIGQIRSDGYKAYDHNASSIQNNAKKAIGNAANAHMLKKSSSGELINGLHKEKQKLLLGKDVLEKLNGKKALEKHGFLQKVLHGTGKYAALYIGDKMGGAIGAVIGDMVGNKIIKAVDKRYGKNLFEKKGVRKAMEILQKDDPKIYKAVEKRLNQYGVQAQEKAKQPIPMGGKTVEGYNVNPSGEKSVPSPSIKIMSAEKINPTRNPKSGQMQKTYGSSGTPVSKEELSKKMSGLFGGNAKTKGLLSNTPRNKKKK